MKKKQTNFDLTLQSKILELVEYAHYLGIDSNTDEEDNEDDDGIKTLTSLDGVKDLGIVGNNPLNKGPPAHTRGSHQHLREE